MARQLLNLFAHADGYIISPSGSCVDMVRHHYSELFPEGAPEHRLAEEVAARAFEITEFLVDILKVTDVGATYHGKVTYHASCHGLRGLGIRSQPKELLKNVKGLELVPLDGEETCCGFGGVFSVVYPEVSRSMMDAKLDAIEASGADTVVACDAGCLMNIGGGLHKRGGKIKARHIVDVLASHAEEGRG
jgi:L-lactate dehydrogenase complex protein LldE